MINQFKNCLLPIAQENQKQPDLKCAAVLLPLIFDEQSDDWQVLFTTRAKHLKHHPGQISFPGGRYETTDGDLSSTALRETREEIGIIPEHIQLLGQLPQQKTTSQFNITPFVAVIDSNYQIIIDKNEVEEVFTAPLSFVTNVSNQQKVTEKINGIEYSFYVIQFNHYKIWGATARILVNLTRRLNSSNSTTA